MRLHKHEKYDFTLKKKPLQSSTFLQHIDIFQIFHSKASYKDVLLRACSMIKKFVIFSCGKNLIIVKNLPSDKALKFITMGFIGL
jgi:hypothetical protein